MVQTIFTIGNAVISQNVRSQLLCSFTPPSQPKKWRISSWMCIERTSNRIANTQPKLRTNPPKLRTNRIMNNGRCWYKLTLTKRTNSGEKVPKMVGRLCPTPWGTPMTEHTISGWPRNRAGNQNRRNRFSRKRKQNRNRPEEPKLQSEPTLSVKLCWKTEEPFPRKTARTETVPPPNRNRTEPGPHCILSNTLHSFSDEWQHIKNWVWWGDISQGDAKGGRQKEFDRFLKNTIGDCLVTFSVTSLMLLRLFSVTFLPDSFCRTSLEAGRIRKQSVMIEGMLGNNQRRDFCIQSWLRGLLPFCVRCVMTNIMTYPPSVMISMKESFVSGGMQPSSWHVKKDSEVFW